jgi:hypothetical protein
MLVAVGKGEADVDAKGFTVQEARRIGEQARPGRRGGAGRRPRSDGADA